MSGEEFKYSNSLTIGIKRFNTQETRAGRKWMSQTLLTCLILEQAPVEVRTWQTRFTCEMQREGQGGKIISSLLDLMAG